MNQFAFSNAGARFALLLPILTVFHQFWPERIQAALGWLRGVDGTAAVLQEVTLSDLRLPKAQQVFETDNVTALELLDWKIHEGRSSPQVVLREVDVSRDLTAFCAAGLAGESDALHG